MKGANLHIKSIQDNILNIMATGRNALSRIVAILQI
jgi:hypothetical protein